MKKFIALGAVLVAANPAAAVAQDQPPTPKQSASQACKDERTAMGAETFANTYGTNANKKNAFGKCVSKRAKEAKAEAKTAKQECKAAAKAIADKAERKAARKACNKKAEKEVKAEMKETTEERASAAETCKKEQEADSEAFAAKYGTNANKRNAFGKCVSSQAKQQESDDEGEKQDKPEKPGKPKDETETEGPQAS